MLDLLVKGFQLWEPGNKSEKIWIRKEWKTPLWMVCVQMRTKTMRERRNPGKKDFKDSGINYWGDFINPWTPGYDSYKPWIY